MPADGLRLIALAPRSVDIGDIRMNLGRQLTRVGGDQT